MDKEKDGKETKEKEEEGVDSEGSLVLTGGKLDIDKILTPAGKKFIKEEGIMPFNPVEMAGDEEASIKLGTRAGEVYGGSLYAIVSAALRDDLPIEKRVRRAMMGARPLLSMFFSATDVYNRFSQIENSILLEDVGLTPSGAKKYGSRQPDAADVIKDLKKQMDDLKRENTELKTKANEGKGKAKAF